MIPISTYLDPGVFRASAVLDAGKGFCVGKSALLAAAARATGIAARPGYADVRNHLTSPRLKVTVGDTFYWHSYTELKVDGKWVKCTPAFDSGLCERANIAPLEFDGATDSLFQPVDLAGRRHMEYLADRGTFADVPFETIVADFKKFYPKLLAAGSARRELPRRSDNLMRRTTDSRHPAAVVHAYRKSSTAVSASTASGMPWRAERSRSCASWVA